MDELGHVQWQQKGTTERAKKTWGGKSEYEQFNIERVGGLHSTRWPSLDRQDTSRKKKANTNWRNEGERGGGDSRRGRRVRLV